MGTICSERVRQQIDQQRAGLVGSSEVDHGLGDLQAQVRFLIATEHPRLVHQLLGNLGQMPASDAPRLAKRDLRRLKGRGVRFGQRAIHLKSALPQVELRASLWAAFAGVERPTLPEGDRVEVRAPRAFYECVGYAVVDGHAVRVDKLVERRRRGRSQRSRRRFA